MGRGPSSGASPRQAAPLCVASRSSSSVRARLSPLLFHPLSPFDVFLDLALSGLLAPTEFGRHALPGIDFGRERTRDLSQHRAQLHYAADHLFLEFLGNLRIKRFGAQLVHFRDAFLDQAVAGRFVDQVGQLKRKLGENTQVRSSLLKTTTTTTKRL